MEVYEKEQQKFEEIKDYLDSSKDAINETIDELVNQYNEFLEFPESDATHSIESLFLMSKDLSYEQLTIIDEHLEFLYQHMTQGRRFPRWDRELIKYGTYKAVISHGKTKRKSGERFSQHPIGTSLILAQAGADAITVFGGLVHDLVEEDEFYHELTRLYKALEKSFKDKSVFKRKNLTSLGKQDIERIDSEIKDLRKKAKGIRNKSYEVIQEIIEKELKSGFTHIIKYLNDNYGEKYQERSDRSFTLDYSVNRFCNITTKVTRLTGEFYYDYISNLVELVTKRNLRYLTPEGKDNRNLNVDVVRALSIKLADRIHNRLTMGSQFSIGQKISANQKSSDILIVARDYLLNNKPTQVKGDTYKKLYNCASRLFNQVFYAVFPILDDDLNNVMRTNKIRSKERMVEGYGNALDHLDILFNREKGGIMEEQNYILEYNKPRIEMINNDHIKQIEAIQTYRWIFAHIKNNPKFNIKPQMDEMFEKFKDSKGDFLI